MNREVFREFVTSYYFDNSAFWDSISLDNSPMYTFCGDMQNNVFLISDNMRHDFGFESNIISDWFGEWGKRICEKDKSRYFHSIDEMIARKRVKYNFRCEAIDTNGHAVWLHYRGIMRWDENQEKPLFFSGNAFNLESESEADPVSGTLRYSVALQDLNCLLNEKKATLMVGIGLNYYSFVNVSNGRFTADRMLRDIFKQLTERFGRDFIFYRIDGLRFIAFCSENMAEKIDLDELTGEIKSIIKSVYQSRNIWLDYPCSIGYIKCPDDGNNAFELIEKMVGTVNEAKLFPELDYMLFSRDILRKRQKEAEMLLRINECVDRNCCDFHIVIQPIVDAQSGAISKGETLLRWTYKGKIVPPGEFIPLLEKSRLIIPIGKWIFEQAVRACKTIQKYIPDFKLSFNVSYLQVMDESFFPFMHETLEKYGMDGENMIIELTETHFDSMPEAMMRWLENCKNLGMKFALDDFGNGYSSLNFLFRYPTDIIKIDRGLVREIQKSEKNLYFLKSIVYACHHAGKSVCIEGVETEQELEAVRETQCDYIQGYYFYPPKELNELYGLLACNDTANRLGIGSV